MIRSIMLATKILWINCLLFNPFFIDKDAMISNTAAMIMTTVSRMPPITARRSSLNQISTGDRVSMFNAQYHT